MEEGKKWGKCGVRLRKYHNYGMANDTLRKRPMMVKIIGVVVVTFLAVVFLFLLTLKEKRQENGDLPNPWRWTG